MNKYISGRLFFVFPMTENVPSIIEKEFKYLSPVKISTHIQNYQVESRVSNFFCGLWPLKSKHTSITLGARMPEKTFDCVDYSDFNGGLSHQHRDMFYFFNNGSSDIGFLQIERGKIHLPFENHFRTEGRLYVGSNICPSTYYEAATLHIGSILRGSEKNMAKRTMPFTKRVVITEAGKSADLVTKDIVYVKEQPSFCRWKYAGNTSNVISIDLFVQDGVSILQTHETLGAYKPVRHRLSKILSSGPKFSQHP